MGEPRHRVAITGASGLIGSALSVTLATAGHGVVAVNRGSTDAFDEVDAVVHLAGEPIGRRWTAKRKAEILRSRDEGTRSLAVALAGLDRPPAALLCASAVGIYGSRGDEVLTEESRLGDDFLARVCQRWEAATRPASDAGIRVANLRFGVVLEALLPRLLVPFKLGLGGRIGDGTHWLSWITLSDVAAAIGFVLGNPYLNGPLNVTSPEPVTNLELTNALGTALHRPTALPLPTFVVSACFGEMATGTVLASQRAVPRRLREAGFEPTYPQLESALRHVLRSTARS